MSITGHQPQKPIMVIATPRSGSTLFTRCLSKAIGASALHEPQMRITEINSMLSISKAKSKSKRLNKEERSPHREIHDKACISDIEIHLKRDAGQYPIRKEMTAFTVLDVESLKTIKPNEDGFNYATRSMISLVSDKYFDDITDQCEKSETPIILICANPVDIMHSVLRTIFESKEKGSFTKDYFEESAQSIAEYARKYYTGYLELKKIFEERNQPYLEVTREQVLGDLTGTVNHAIEACKLSGEATNKLSPAKLYDNKPPSPDTIDYTLSYDDTFVSKHERSHNYFTPKTEKRTLSERLRDVIAEKFEGPVDDLMALVKEGEEEVREIYQNAQS